MNLGEIIMEKNNKKFIIPIIIIIILLSITVYKIINTREKKLYEVLYKNIEYQAKQCFLKNDCKDKTTLKELYNLKYLEKQFDPVTKEILDENITIEYKDDKIIINK